MATWFETIAHGRMWLETCVRCSTPFMMSEAVHATATARREGFTFYCPNGHEQHYVTGETQLDKMRRERDRLAQQVAQRDDEIRAQREHREAAERRASAARGQVTRLRNRAAAGTCPCCNRTFANMTRHMASQHPGFRAEELE